MVGLQLRARLQQAMLSCWLCDLSTPTAQHMRAHHVAADGEGQLLQHQQGPPVCFQQSSDPCRPCLLAALLAGTPDLRTHSALSATAGCPDLLVKARRLGLFPGKCGTAAAACRPGYCMWPKEHSPRASNGSRVFLRVRPLLLIHACVQAW